MYYFERYIPQFSDLIEVFKIILIPVISVAGSIVLVILSVLVIGCLFFILKELMFKLSEKIVEKIKKW